MSTDPNTTAKITFEDGTDAEKATIEIRNFGGLSELNIDGKRLDAVGVLTGCDVPRFLEALKLAETKRVSPDPKTIEALVFLADRYSYFTEDDPTRMSIIMKLIMPIVSCGSVSLVPNFGDDQPPDSDWEEG